MKNREIYKKVCESYKNIAKEILKDETQHYKIHTIYEIIEELSCQGLDITEKQEDMLCDYVYNAYLEYDGTNINIYNIVYTVSNLMQNGITVNDILEMDIKDFCNQIII